MGKTTGLWRRLFYSSFTKIVIGLLVCIGLLTITQIGLKNLLAFTAFSKDVKDLIVTAVSVLLVIIAYKLLYRFYEKRQITELSTKNLGKNLLAGILTGAGLQALTILVIYINGGFSVIAVNNFFAVLPALGMALGAA
jgi:hypothetical protein